MRPLRQYPIGPVSDKASKPLPIWRGTESSNPLPSTDELQPTVSRAGERVQAFRRRVRWHRSGFRLYWRWKSRRRVGRPVVPADIHDLARTISRDNPLWGAPRIHGELLKLVSTSPSRLSPSTCHGVTAPAPRVGRNSCAITALTSPPSICSSFRRSGSNCSTGWSSWVWSGDGSSGPAQRDSKSNRRVDRPADHRSIPMG